MDNRYLSRILKALRRTGDDIEPCVRLNGRLWAKDENGQVIEYMAVSIPKMSELIQELKRVKRCSN